jgi:CBS domain-containing protein
MKGREQRLSLHEVGETVLTYLHRLDFDLAKDYLAAVRTMVSPLREKIDSARAELSRLIAKAAVAQDTAALALINDEVVEFASELFLSVQSVPMVQELCTEVRDAIAERALELSRKKLFFSGTSCEIPVSLLAVGSDGRREQLLFTDQDYLFLIGSEENDHCRSEEETDDYFAMLGAVFADKLEEAGISRCSGGIMPVNADWRGSLQQWQERLATMLRFERNDWEKNILSVIALMDVRFVCGDSQLANGFGAMVRSTVGQDQQAIKHIARVVSSMKLSKGWLKRFVVEGDGAHKGEFNLKLLAWMPLVMCIRLLAVNLGIEETSTMERIARLRGGGHLNEKLAEDLSEAYLVVTGQRILQQIRRLKRVIDDDCYINPHELPTDEREALRTAIGSVDELQSMIRTGFSMVATADRMITPHSG